MNKYNKILIVCDHYPLSPRVQKLRESIIKMDSNCEIVVFAWNRNHVDVKEDFVYAHNSKSGYGNKANVLLNLASFGKELRRFVYNFKPSRIHAIDFLMLLLIKADSKYEVIYEVYDIKFIRISFLNRIREKIEKTKLKNVKKIILASKFFQQYYQDLIGDKFYYVLNNKPTKVISDIYTGYLKEHMIRMRSKYVIGFVGNIRHYEILVNLINSIKDYEDVVVLLAGSGPSEAKVHNYCSKNNLLDKVIFSGRFTYDDLMGIYNSIDLVWAAYPNDNRNVYYAISNKYYESQIFSIPIVVAEKTLLAEEVNKMSLGFSVNPYSVEDIRKKIQFFKESSFEYPSVNKEEVYWESEMEIILNIYEIGDE